MLVVEFLINKINVWPLRATTIRLFTGYVFLTLMLVIYISDKRLLRQIGLIA